MIDTSDGFVPLLERRAIGTPEGVFARIGGEALTFGRLWTRSDAIAHWLRREGVGTGDRVALMIPNSADAIALLFGIAKAGAVWVPVNVQQKGDGLAYILEHSAPSLIVGDADTAPTAAAAFPPAPVWTLGTAAASGARRVEDALGDETPFGKPLPDVDDPFAIMYTSGTTGRPKGVLVSHRMLRLSGEAVRLVSGAEAGNVMFMWEPLYHIGGAQMIILPLIEDVSLALVPRFSASRFWQEVIDTGASHIHFLGGILQLLLKQPESPLDRAHGARIAWGGGCPREIWRPFEARFGVEIRECYGMTEASSVTTCNERKVLGSVGRPLPWFDVTLIGEDGREVAQGERGEIVVRTSLPGALTRGYYHNPEATAKALRDGALHTGDIGSFDTDGNMTFHGRMTDNVRVKGENVTAFEVESVAAKHPDVEDCAMIGVKSDVGEQDIKLIVTLRAGARLAPAALSAWLSERLAPYQNPRYIEVIEAFERTPSQRIMKHRLSRDTAGCWQRPDGRTAPAGHR